MSDSYPPLAVETIEQWRSWLEVNHGSSPGVWLVVWKKASGRPTIAWADVVDEALCYGWVDSRPRAVDARRSSRLITPRKPTSNWSARNKDRVAALTAQGRMQQAGLEAVEVARRNGRWEALDEVETLTEPSDLARDLDANPDARRYWDAFPRSTRRAILEWISNAKGEATRQSRLERTVSDAALNVRTNQWRQPKGASSGEVGT